MVKRAKPRPELTSPKPASAIMSVAVAEKMSAIGNTATALSKAESPAAASIKAGDVIVQVANEPVADPQDVAKRIDTVKKTSRKSAMLEVEDGKGSHRFITVPVE